MTVTVDEVLKALPEGNVLIATVRDTDGSMLIGSTPILRPDEAADIPDDAEWKDMAAVNLTLADGSDYSVVWPVETVSVDGLVVTLAGPKGRAQLSRLA